MIATKVAPPNAPTASRREKGRDAEELAELFLARRGIKILTRNWQDRRGELDLIGREGDGLRIIEVRSRSAGSSRQPEASLGPRKVGRLSAAARDFIHQNRLTHVPVRFDLLVIDWEMDEINYYPGGIVPPNP